MWSPPVRYNVTRPGATMKRLLLPLTAIAIASLVLPMTGARTAYACSCGYQTQEKVQLADLIVIGIATSATFEGPIDDVEKELIAGRSSNRLSEVEGVVEVSVESYLKGSGPPSLTVGGNQVAASLDAAGKLKLELGSPCGTFDEASVDKRYLLFLWSGSSGRYVTSACTGSMPLSPASETQYRVYPEDFAAALAQYDAVFGLPDGTLLAVANSPAAALPPLGGPPSASDAFPWIEVIAGTALLAAGTWLLRRRTPA